jgi:hypothetical protein
MTARQHDASHTITDRDRVIALDANVYWNRIWAREPIQRVEEAEPIRPTRSFAAMGEKG